MTRSNNMIKVSCSKPISSSFSKCKRTCDLERKAEFINYGGKFYENCPHKSYSLSNATSHYATFEHVRFKCHSNSLFNSIS